MGIWSFSIGESKGIDCEINNQDGVISASCKRTIKQKDGSLVTDGQTVQMSADPSNDCNISYNEHLSVLDNDGFKTFDPVAKRLQKSCRRSAKKGMLPNAPKTQ